jgi:hypothetical protein
MAHAARRRILSGFSMVELLAVAAIASMLVVGLSQALGLFGREVEAVRAESDHGPEEALALMTDMARYGWLVESPDEHRLDVVDAAGGRTSFAVVDGALRVTRPSGATGTLLPGVAGLAIDTDTVHRLRDATPLDDHRTWWQVPAQASPATLGLESGLPLALGFTLSSIVPDDYDAVAGVDEHTVYAALETLVLSLAYVGSIPSDPNIPIAGTGGGGSKKVKICHVPPGNPANAHTLNISINALDAHLDHGDLLGTCEPPPDTQAYPDLTIQLFEARAPDDARPVGAPLASMTLMGHALPLGSASWSASGIGPGTHTTHDHSAAQCAATTASGKVIMCHVPPGNPANAHSITIAPSAVAAHLAHGDYFGCCGDHSTSTSVYTLNLNATPAEFAFDLSPLGALILPGRAYTLVLSMAGPGVVYVGASSLGSAGNSGVAQAVLPYGDLTPAAVSVPFQLKGMQRITQTAEHDPVSRLSLTLQMEDGQAVSGSTSITSQASVPGTWLGAVSGEPAEIDP